MKKRDHQKIVRAINKKHAAELARLKEFWQTEVAERQAIIELYAQSLDQQDAEIARLRGEIL